jgi:hypothetical protein
LANVQICRAAVAEVQVAAAAGSSAPSAR